jgi:hypothetical protein
MLPPLMQAQYPDGATPQLFGWHFKVCNIDPSNSQTVKKMRLYCGQADLLYPTPAR